MSEKRYTIRDDDRYRVVVGWNAELETFVLLVFGARDDAARPFVDLGAKPHEVPTISDLSARTAPYATVSPAVISDLRHDARPLSDQAHYPDPSAILADAPETADPQGSGSQVR